MQVLTIANDRERTATILDCSAARMQNLTILHAWLAAWYPVYTRCLFSNMEIYPKAWFSTFEKATSVNQVSHSKPCGILLILHSVRVCLLPHTSRSQSVQIAQVSSWPSISPKASWTLCRLFLPREGHYTCWGSQKPHYFKHEQVVAIILCKWPTACLL